jgi:hypothetical protein
MTQSICSSSSSSQRSMSPVVRLAVLASLLLGIGSPLAIHAQADQGAEPHTEAAVIADAHAWSKAEDAGDVAYVDSFVLPEFQSINADGSVRDKASIVASTRKNIDAAHRAARLADNAKWKATHRYATKAVITGDTAILTYLLDTPDSKPVLSSDTFVYQDGHWKVIFSQQSDAGK